MMSLEAWLTFCATETVLCLTPGPAVLFVVSVAQAANPKALVFFVALLPQFIDPTAPVAIQVLILGTSSVLIEWMVLSLYVAVTVQAQAAAGTRWAGSMERIGGGFLIAAGTRLALLRVR